MADSNDQITQLLIKHLREGLTPAEREELSVWAEGSDQRQQILARFLDDRRLQRGVLDHWVQDRIWQRLKGLSAGVPVGMPPVGMPPAGTSVASETPAAGPAAEVVGIRRMRRWYWAAAVLAPLMVLGVYLLFKPSFVKNPVVVSGHQPPVFPAPSITRATITLADGRQIALDSATSGRLAIQGSVQVMKLADGQLAYTGKDNETFYNTLTNPRGSRVVTVTLNDGTKVWLNTASSIRYPTVFTGGERRVRITGEVYFEVAQNARQPFVVEHGETEVTVLGTSFNINAYDDEPGFEVTLLDGAVRVSRGSEHSMLRPGEQARVGAALQVVRDADVETVMAWKNGRFRFEGANVEEVMRQVARWYDVDVVYQGKPTGQHFRGDLPRTADASAILDIMESTEAIHFKIQGRQITVLP